MYISKETIETLKAQGINVRWFPEETYEEFKKAQWEKEYKHWFDYSKSSCKELNPPRNDGSYQSWNFETLAEYEDHIKDGGQILVKKENVKSKEITVEYVQKLVEKDRKVYAGTYGKFAMAMQRLCKERGYTSRFLVYPTTYGIGVWLFYNFHAEENIADVKSLMDERGIEYYNEFSDHHWVYRFKVSKKRENIERMCA